MKIYNADSLEECMALHDTDVNAPDNPSGSSWWDTITNGIQNFAYDNSDKLEKAATDAANKAASNELNKLLGSGNASGNTSKSSSSSTPANTGSTTETAMEFISTPTGAGVVGAAVATGAYIGISKKNKHRVIYSVLAGALAGAGTYYATKK
jgi:stress-induced morphogen